MEKKYAKKSLEKKEKHCDWYVVKRQVIWDASFCTHHTKREQESVSVCLQKYKRV